MRAIRAFLIGAGAAYLLDPQQGKRRRHVLRDRSGRLLRKTGRFVARRARYLAGHLRGAAAVARLRAVPPARSVDDDAVLQRIRSDALRDVGISTRDVDVQVAQGVATLRGSVETRSLADDLVERVRKVPGVRAVTNELEPSSAEQTTASTPLT